MIYQYTDGVHLVMCYFYNMDNHTAYIIQMVLIVIVLLSFITGVIMLGIVRLAYENVTAPKGLKYIAFIFIGLAFTLGSIGESFFENDYILEVTAINGVVVEKYIDTHQHMFKMMVVRNTSDGKEERFNIHNWGIYEVLVVGDVILKKSGEPTLVIYRDGRLIYKRDIY